MHGELYSWSKSQCIFRGTHDHKGCVQIFRIIWNYPCKLSRLHRIFYYRSLPDVRLLTLWLNLFLVYGHMFFYGSHQKYLTSKPLSNLQSAILLFFYWFLSSLLCLYGPFGWHLKLLYLLGLFTLDFLKIVNSANSFFYKIYNIKQL